MSAQPYPAKVWLLPGWTCQKAVPARDSTWKVGEDARVLAGSAHPLPWQNPEQADSLTKQDVLPEKDVPEVKAPVHAKHRVAKK